MTKIISVFCPKWIQFLYSKCNLCTFAVLKKSVAILFLSVYLISATELQQLVKLPLLIEHYQEHKQKNRNLSFVDFLNMHYSQQQELDADYDRDMQLPFKSHDGCSTSFLSVFLNGATTELPNKTAFSASVQFSAYTDNFLSQAYLASIWQPPKSC